MREGPATSHAATRLSERYGITLTPGEMRALAARLTNGAGVVLDRADGIEKRLISVNGTDVVVIWKPHMQYIVSVLPKRRALPKMLPRKRGRNGKTKSEGRRPEREVDTDG